MKIYIGADHRGFELKEKLKGFLREKGFEVVDKGNFVFDPHDDFPDFAQAVARAVRGEHGSFGIVICGSGVGVDIACNRFSGIRCCLGFDKDQVRSAREDDHCNILALAADFIDLDEAEEMIMVFLTTKEKQEERYLRRIKKIDI